MTDKENINKMIDDARKKCLYPDNCEGCEEDPANGNCVFLLVVNHLINSGVMAQRHGHWIYNGDDLFPCESTQECSVCHEHEWITLQNENFCPHCGAKMDWRMD